MIKIAGWRMLVLGAILGGVSVGHAEITPELQKAIRESTFEVVMKKPESDPLSYEKPLPLDLIPYIERNDAYRSVGTAFALGNNTYVTAAHVFQVAVGSQFGPPALRRADGTVFAVDKILKFSAREDFVVFSLSKDPGSPGFKVNRDPKVDEPVLAVGNALGDGIVIRDGLFTSETAEAVDGRWKWIRFSAAASPGNSGGPLCDASGRVIGIVIGKSPNENLNYSLPMSRVLDDVASKAHFEQRAPIGLPFLHGTVTYSFKGDFGLPLSWTAFNAAAIAFLRQHDDEARALVLKTFSDALFPKGMGSDDLLFEPTSDVRPRVIQQAADGTWSAPIPEYREIRLASDGSVAAGMTASAQAVHIIRAGAASDDAFYEDSKAFMDLALKGLDLRRVVGTDQVRVTSLGTAIQSSVFTDQYGRRWQERVWAIPYLDVYAVGLLLPTPDGYSAMLVPVPSVALHTALENLHLIANLTEVSYRGTLAQWQAMLRRRALLPKALEDLKLDKSPNWTLRTPRFVSSVPASVLQLKDDSPLSLTMGFMPDGARTVWDIEEVRWEADERHESTVALWRRAEPPNDVGLEIRNRFDSIRARRTPFDGQWTRDSESTLAATRILDVPGKTPGSVASSLAYGLTVRLPALRDPSLVRQSVDNTAAVTQVLERSTGSDMPRPASNTSSSGKPLTAALVDPLHSLESNLTAESDSMDVLLGKDIRGRHVSDDMRDLMAAADAGSGNPASMDDVKRRAGWLRAYWNESPAIVHSREMWPDFLQKNHMPPNKPHSETVVRAESDLSAALKQPPGADWGERARTLRVAYVAERTSLARTAPTGALATFTDRTTPCQPAATTTSGTKLPKVGQASRDLEQLWPLASKRLGEEGTVLATLQVSNGGCVTAIAIVGSSGSDWMDQAVREYFESMAFIPGAVDGKAIDTRVTVPVVFKLTSDSPAWVSR